MAPVYTLFWDTPYIYIYVLHHGAETVVREGNRTRGLKQQCIDLSIHFCRSESKVHLLPPSPAACLLQLPAFSIELSRFSVSSFLLLFRCSSCCSSYESHIFRIFSLSLCAFGALLEKEERVERKQKIILVEASILQR